MTTACHCRVPLSNQSSQSDQQSQQQAVPPAPVLVQEERKVLEEAKFAAVGYETTTKDGKAVRLTGAAAAAAGKYR